MSYQRERDPVFLGHPDPDPGSGKQKRIRILYPQKTPIIIFFSQYPDPQLVLGIIKVRVSIYIGKAKNRLFITDILIKGVWCQPQSQTINNYFTGKLLNRGFPRPIWT